MQNLLEHLRSLEVELHQPSVRSSSKRLEALLHPDFREVGRSGRQYDRRTIIDHLRHGVAQPSVVAEGFCLSDLAPGAALLTYRSAHRDRNGILVNHAHRASLWVETPLGWQVLYHQGTPAATSW